MATVGSVTERLPEGTFYELPSISGQPLTFVPFKAVAFGLQLTSTEVKSSHKAAGR